MNQMTAIAHRPISLKSDSVYRIVHGGKRRHTFLLNPQPQEGQQVALLSDREDKPLEHIGGALYASYKRGEEPVTENHLLPWRRGQSLWLREEFALVRASDREPYDWIDDGRPLRRGEGWWVQPMYRATEMEGRFMWDHAVGGPGWRSSSEMPPWASRFDLAIRNVTLRRLQSCMDEEQAVLEGFTGGGALSALDCFQTCWNREHPTSPWSSNPWVAVVRFKAEKRGGVERIGEGAQLLDH